MNKNIYSIVLSDEVVEAVDRLARSERISRSAMVNRILAERVAYTTPEMRLSAVLDSLMNAMTEEFLLDKPAGGTLMARTSLKYRYKPTVRYSVELFSENGKRAGELKVSFRTTNAELIRDLTGFFKCWTALEQRYIAALISGDIIYEIAEGRFSRTLNMPDGEISDNDLGAAVAEYMEMFDNTMKRYFAELPDVSQAETAAEEFYKSALKKQTYII